MGVLWTRLVTLWVLCLAQLGAQLVLNGGAFCFTLDDPYIHLALSENLWKHGHYGVNLGEVSAPSSSVLWPFLVAPISDAPLAVLFLNIGLASATVLGLFGLGCWGVCLWVAVGTAQSRVAQRGGPVGGLVGLSWKLSAMGLGVLPSSIQAKVAADPELRVLGRWLDKIWRILIYP